MIAIFFYFIGAKRFAKFKDEKEAKLKNLNKFENIDNEKDSADYD